MPREILLPCAPRFGRDRPALSGLGKGNGTEGRREREKEVGEEGRGRGGKGGRQVGKRGRENERGELGEREGGRQRGVRKKGRREGEGKSKE